MPLSEKALISRIRARSTSHPFVSHGIGDDCAVLRLPAHREILVTTDFSLEMVHFRRNWHPARNVGHRCLARGLSDIASMGGVPHSAFLSLALPRSLPQAWVDQFLAGLLSLASKFGVALAGGDIAQSPAGVLADIMVVGSAPKGKAILRSGGRPGDHIYVTGKLGGSAAALELLTSGRAKQLKPASYKRHFAPIPRIAVGLVLRERSLASAMIDTSDGLSTDLGHICEESGVGAEINAGDLPRAELIGIGSARSRAAVDLRFALHGGEDYELVFTARPSKIVPPVIEGVPITRIGRIVKGTHIVLLTKRGSKKLAPKGWEHFRSR